MRLLGNQDPYAINFLHTIRRVLKNREKCIENISHVSLALGYI